MDRDAEYLLDMLSSARLVCAYVEGAMRDEFLQETKLQDSVIRRLEIIGEAAGRISPQFRDQNPEIQWAGIRGM